MGACAMAEIRSSAPSEDKLAGELAVMVIVGMMIRYASSRWQGDAAGKEWRGGRRYVRSGPHSRATRTVAGPGTADHGTRCGGPSSRGDPFTAQGARRCAVRAFSL